MGHALETVLTIAFLLPIFVFCLVKILWWVLMGEIDLGPGLLAMAFVIIGFCMAILSQNTLIQGMTVAVMVSLIVAFPFAENYLDRHDLREINAEHIDRAILELSIHPDNFPAWFKLSESLFTAGYHGHAIALAEQTINRIPNEPDPFQNRSMRDMYMTEERMIGRWRADSHPRRQGPIKCPKCANPNAPGTINCTKCGVPYLLLISRNVGTRGGAFVKLVVGWACIAAVIPLAAWWGTTGTGFAMFGGIVLGLVVLGGILHWIFRDPSGQPERFRPFS